MKQKRLGVLLILLGGAALVVIGILLYFNLTHIPGFAAILPAKETIAVVEFPSQSANPITAYFSNQLGIDWQKDISPWAGEKAGGVLLFSESEKRLIPFLLIQTKSPQSTVDFLKKYRNDAQNIVETKHAEFSVFETPSASAAFISDTVVLGQKISDVNFFLDRQTPFSLHLSDDPGYKKIRKAQDDPFFAYLDPRNSGMPYLLSNINPSLPELPVLTLAKAPISMGAHYTNGVFQGVSSVVLPTGSDVAGSAEKPYLAKLLSFVPEAFDGFVAGQNFISYAARGGESARAAGPAGPNLPSLIKKTLATYLPDISTQDLAAVLSSEFAATITGNQILFITQLNEKNGAETATKIRASFPKAALQFTNETRDVTLADGTKAAESYPNLNALTTIEETFGRTTVYGIMVNQKGDGIFDAVLDNTWFVSTDLLTLKKSLRLAMREDKTGSLRENELYRTFLQPILKNPELLGITQIPFGKLSFSKQEIDGSMETNFVLMLQ